MRTLLKPIELALAYLMVRSAPRRDILGFRLCCSSVQADCELFFQQTGDALALIQTHDPNRFARIARDVKQVCLTSRGISFYERLFKAVFLDVAVLDGPSEVVATTIIHEATHARLYRAGIRDYAKHAGRHERICVAQEIDFASRLPAADQLVPRLRSMLDEPWWNESGRQEQITLFAERFALPSWVRRILIRFGAKR